MTTLAARHCVPCEGGTPPIPETGARAMLDQVPGWDLHDSMLTRRFKLKDFAEAMAFVNSVAALAESEGHHPDIFISYNRVRLDLTTHAIKGLSDNDFIMAARINELAKPGRA